MTFDEWYVTLRNIAANHGESIPPSDKAELRERCEKEKAVLDEESALAAFHAKFPQHKKRNT